MTEIPLADRPFLFRPNSSDEGVIRQIFHNRDYDLKKLRRSGDLMAYWRANAANGRRPLIVDAGANIGAASIYFLQQFPDAQLVAVEPDRQNFEILAINAAGLPILCLNRAVTSSPGQMTLVDPGEGNWGFRTAPMTDGPVSGSAIETVQIGRIFDTRPPDTYPFIVKIDIEGGEDDLFSADIEWLGTTPLIIIELHDWLIPKGRTSLNFLRAISRLDRDFVHIGENIFSIDNRL